MSKAIRLSATALPLRQLDARHPAAVLALPGPARRNVAATERPSWFSWLLRRQEPTVYHRCLAVHLHFAENNSALTT